MSKLFIEPGSSLQNHTGSWRTQRPSMLNKWPPCGQTCPANEDIQAWLALASDLQWEAAWRKLTERNPFPSVMGRVCYHPCESACNRKHLDDSVNIHGVERFLGDLAIKNGWQHKKIIGQSAKCSVGEKKPKKIAIIGAGPAGLSCAYQLAIRNYQVTIFDAAPIAGGTLSSGIPDYRLPKNILKQEIDAILALGIELKLNCRVGEQVSAKALQGEFDGLFLAVGAQKPRLFHIEEYAQHSVMTGVDFLRQINEGLRINLPPQVVVVGGGNTAIDVARCVSRMGSKVTVVCAQDPHGAHLGHPGAEIPASPLEINHAENEGANILYRSAVSRLVRSGMHLSGVEISRVDKIHDRHGHFKPVLFEGTEEFIAAGLVVFAIGQEIDWQGLECLIEIKQANIVLGGDAAGQARFASTAVGSGFQGAMSIISHLTGVPAKFEHHKKSEVSYKKLNLPYYPQKTRINERHTVECFPNFCEIAKGFDEFEAHDEATRCLSCGVCFQCDNCWHFCPDAAIVKEEGKYHIDYDYCKGCGICVKECPSGHIQLDIASL